MPRKPRIVLTILGVITALEALAGLFLASLTLGSLSIHRQVWTEIVGVDYPHFYELYAVVGSTNLVLLGMLFVSAFLLLRLRRKGLFLLVVTLGMEVLLFIGLTIAPSSVDREFGSAIAAASGIGMVGMSPQLFTAYPLVALVLLVMAYRYLGIPARA